MNGEASAPWYAIMAAFEVHDSARTHLYACAHFLGTSEGANEVLAYSSSPYNIVTLGPDNLFIYGGGYGDDSSASGSFVASVEPGTLNERWFFKQLTKYTTEQVVWRHAATGDELARSNEFPKMSAGILVTPGYAGLQYFLTADGHIIALQVDSSGSG